MEDLPTIQGDIRGSMVSAGLMRFPPTAVEIKKVAKLVMKCFGPEFALAYTELKTTHLDIVIVGDNGDGMRTQVTYTLRP